MAPYISPPPSSSLFLAYTHYAHSETLPRVAVLHLVPFAHFPFVIPSYVHIAYSLARCVSLAYKGLSPSTSWWIFLSPAPLVFPPSTVLAAALGTVGEGVIGEVGGLPPTRAVHASERRRGAKLGAAYRARVEERESTRHAAGIARYAVQRMMMMGAPAEIFPPCMLVRCCI